LVKNPRPERPGVFLWSQNDAGRIRGREMQREKSTVDIGVRHIEKLTKRHYNAIDILWLRQIISDPYPRVLVWRKQN
jgi:hypothetical protein